MMARWRSGKLPAYVERVPLARRRKPDTWMIVGVEAAMVLVAICAGVFVYYRAHDLPLYATKFYAHMGSSEAQHLLSQYHLSRLYEDPEHAKQAEHWLIRAAEAGHGVAAYNLALAHIRGDLPSNSTPEASHLHRLLSQAVNQGVHEALGLLHYCGHGQCVKQQRRLRQQEQQLRNEELRNPLDYDP